MATFEVKLDDQVSAPAKKASKETRELDKSMRTLQDSMAQGSEGMGSLAGFAEMAGAALAAAAVAVAAFAAAAAVGLGALAIMAGEDRQAMEAFGDAMIGTAGAGKEVDELLKGLAQDLPVTKDKLDKLAKGFMSAGIRDIPALEKALRATAAASALMGDEGGQAFAGLIKKASLFAEAGKNYKNFSKSLKDVGLDVNDVAAQFGIAGKELEGQLKSGKISSAQLGNAIQDAMINKGAGSVEVANKRIGVMFDKMKTAAIDVFDGVVETQGYKDFIGAIQQIGILFGMQSKDAESSITSALGSMFGMASKVLTWMTLAYLKLAIASVRAYIFMFPLLHALAEMWRWTLKVTVQNNTFMLGLKWTAIIIGVLLVPALLLLVAVFVIVMAPIAVLVAMVAALVYAFIWVAGVVADNIMPVLEGLAVAMVLLLGPIGWIGLAMYALWDDLVAAWDAIWDYLGGLYDKASDAAGDFIDGLVDGIVGGAQWVIDAIKGLGKSAITAFKGMLGISSPSKVMMQMGDHMGTGLVEGIDGAANDVAAASSGMGQAAIGGVAGPANGNAGGGGGMNVTFAAGSIVIEGAGKSGEEITEELVTLVFERLAATQGL